MKVPETVADPRNIENAGKRILTSQNTLNVDKSDYLLDESWVSQAFLINDIILNDPDDIANRYFSSATFKFTDTKMGGNLCVNPRPQFTRYCDIRSKGRFGKTRIDVGLGTIGGNFGMGRYYSESIDDSSQNIYLRFGVPQFNSLFSYVSKAFDPQMASLARTGRTTGFFYDAAKMVGTIAGVALFPIIALTVAAGRTLHFLFSSNSSKFYTLKPTMHVYWATVTNLVNLLAINRGIYPKVENDGGVLNTLINKLLPNDKPIDKLTRPYLLDSDQLDEIHRLFPDVFSSSRFFDIFAMANRAQRMSNNIIADEVDGVNKEISSDYTGYLKRNLTGNGTHPTHITNNSGNLTLAAKLDHAFKFSRYFASPETGSTLTESDPRTILDEKDENDKPIKRDPGTFQKFFEYFDADLRDGSQFAVFKVDATGSVSESFSNSVAESDLSQKLNGMSSQARQARFVFAEGNIVGDTVKAAVGAVADVGAGLLAGVTFDFSTFVLGLAGTGYIDIPKYWQSSSANLPRSNYTIQLISPYGNAMSQIQNIYIPLAMLLAGALPLSTGKQSYTSPFICELYDRGRSQVKLGMIESLSITRGTPHLPFNTLGNPMGVDVSFSIVDLSSIMHMPVSSGGITDLNVGIDGDNILSDYLAVLAGQDLYSQMYALPRARLRIAKTISSLNKLTSPAYWASLTHDSLPFMGALEGFVRGTSRAPGSNAGTI